MAKAAKRFTLLSTVDGVIDALGGEHEVARLTERGYTAVCNWRAAKRFPATQYLRMQTALIERGAVARPQLWSQDGAEKHYEIENAACETAA